MLDEFFENISGGISKKKCCWRWLFWFLSKNCWKEDIPNVLLKKISWNISIGISVFPYSVEFPKKISINFQINEEIMNTFFHWLKNSSNKKWSENSFINYRNSWSNHLRIFCNNSRKFPKKLTNEFVANSWEESLQDLPEELLEKLSDEFLKRPGRPSKI